MNSYDVRFWEPRKIGDTAKGRWRVRWAVAGREHRRSFAARPLADGFLTDLKKAAGDRQPFDTAHRPARHPPAAGNRQAPSPGMSTPAPTPTSNGRTWRPSPAGRPPRR